MCWILNVAGYKLLHHRERNSRSHATLTCKWWKSSYNNYSGRVAATRDDIHSLPRFARAKCLARLDTICIKNKIIKHGLHLYFLFLNWKALSSRSFSVFFLMPEAICRTCFMEICSVCKCVVLSLTGSRTSRTTPHHIKIKPNLLPTRTMIPINIGLLPRVPTRTTAYQDHYQLVKPLVRTNTFTVGNCPDTYLTIDN